MEKIKKNRFSKVLVLLLAVMMIFTMMPSMAFADTGNDTGDGTDLPTTEVKTATVYLTSQAAGSFLHAPKTVEVRADLAESYGFTDDLKDGVSVLDVLIKAHQEVFGEDFTKDNMAEYLTGDANYIKTAFGGLDNLGFAVNGKCPNDGVWNENYHAYTGYTINQSQVENGDTVEFFIYQDGYALDNYGILEIKNNEKIYTGQNLSLNVKGYSYCYYGCSKEETIAGQTKPIEDAQIATVDSQSGQITLIKDAITDENGNVNFSLPKAGEYLLTAYMPTEEIEENYATPLIMCLLKVTVTEPNASITVPSNAELFVGSKTKHFVPFVQQQPVHAKGNDDGTTTYFFDLQANKDFSYRVSGENYITYAGKFKTPAAGKAPYSVAITSEQLQPEGITKTTTDKNVKSNSGYNVADIYLNINEQGFLKLNAGDEKQIINLRNWEAVDTTTNNYFIEPDYHYSVYNLDASGRFSAGDDSIVSVDADGKLSAVGEGTAVVLVTYDAINVSSAVGGPFFGAIWPENTGVFVVDVDGTDSGIQTNMTINEGLNAEDTSAGKLAGDKLDAEHDVIYYLTEMTDAENATTEIADAHGEYTFKPSGASEVSVANPNVTESGLSYSTFTAVPKNKDGSYTVKLLEGRNIVKVTNEKGSEYQVITAKGVKAAVTNVTASGKALSAGDEFTVTFDTIYHPANKLSGVYNMSANINYSKVSGYENIAFGSSSNQYQFASSEKTQTISNVATWGQKGWAYVVTLGKAMSIPADYTEKTFKLSEGYLVAAGYGDPYGNHRGITLEEGKAPNFNASIKVGYFGKLPDLTLEIKDTPSADVASVKITKQPTKLSYFEGDVFDPTGLTMEVTYDDGTVRTVKGGFEYSKDALTKDVTEMEISFGGQTQTVSITVQEVVLNKITITKEPTKVAYTEGEYFNPSGMEVTASYNNGDKTVTDYTYEAKTLTTADTKVTITYVDKKSGTKKTAEQAITVSAAPVTPKDEITVSFTLLGDTKHGDSTTKHTLRAGNLDTWISRTSITVDKDAKVLDVLEKALSMRGFGFANESGNYVSEINGLGEFDNGSGSGWMFTLNGHHGNLGVSEQALKNGDVIVFHYTDDYTQEEGSEQWNVPGAAEDVKNVTTTGTSGSAVTTSPTEVKVVDKTTADGTKVKVAEVTVSADNQKEILKQAKGNKSAEIALNVTKDAVGTANSADIKLDKSFLESILKDTNAKLTIKTPFGTKTYTQDELKASIAGASGTTITLTIEKSAELDDAAKLAQAKEQLAKVRPIARSAKTAKKNVKVTLKMDAESAAAIDEIQSLGYTVKYKFYRSTKKAAGYSAKLTKTSKTYLNTSGVKGSKYYYKARVLVYDGSGKLVAFSKLTQCKYAARVWTK